MPKITVHGGPSNAADEPQIVGASWSDGAPDEASAVESMTVTVDGVDQGPPEFVETLGGPFEPLPEAVDGDTTEHVSVPDYEKWTVPQLREVLADRELPTAGLKPELIKRLQDADAEASDG